MFSFKPFLPDTVLAHFEVLSHILFQLIEESCEGGGSEESSHFIEINKV